MKKILSLIGSRSSTSNTVRLSKIVVENIISNNPTLEFAHEILQPEQWGLLPCRSCNNCFFKGFCVLDEVDGMGCIKGKILEADIIIIGSPVFVANISGDTKHLIDRLAMWVHTMPLIGKYGIALSTTSSNNGKVAVNYLGMIMELMGLQVVMRLNAFIHVGEPLLEEKHKLEAVMREPVRSLSDALTNKIRPPFSDILSRHYMYQWEQYTNIKERFPGINSGEQVLWENQGYLPYKTIAELFQGLKL